MSCITNLNSSSGNIAHYGIPYLNTSSGYFVFQDTPNIEIFYTCSIFTSGSGLNSPSSETFSFKRVRNGITTIINSTNFTYRPTSIRTLTSSFNPIKGDQYYFNLSKPSTGAQEFYILASASLLMTQSVNPVAEQCVPVFVEPYVTQNNYYNW